MVTSWQESANRRRDERHTVADIRPPGGSKKDTKRWCRGRVGREHKPECRTYSEHKRVGYGPDWRLLICAECGKELDRYMPIRWFKTKDPVPTWVTA